jgi:N-acetylglucosaminyldiphosphoundecaprenol N-acetyl-beta-D-mannosaminyltransferase
MPLPLRARVLGCPVDVVDMDAAVRRLADLIGAHDASGGAVVVTLNPEMVMRARREPDFARILESAALVVPDGVGLVRALRRRGFPQAVRVGGVDLVDAYTPQALERGERIALVGGAGDVASRAADQLRSRHPGLDVVADSGDPDFATAARVAEHSPQLLCVAYGAGRQERFLRDHLRTIGAAAGIGVGGTLDYLAGTARRAPRVVRSAGFEWLWRLALEPRRWRRQLVLPQFWWLERREVAG